MDISIRKLIIINLKNIRTGRAVKCEFSGQFLLATKDADSTAKVQVRK